ncbi:MAG: efflux RND transporter periplasmic adaptor subunit [Gemmatimonadetes bacterium]|nr:efflux RND transporter periplasmic adaptor subunit [Gemmatimonadota bacterium]
MLDTAQMRSAAIAVQPVGALPADTISLTGTVGFDGARVSHVASRIQGRIRRVYADIGTHVSRGDTLAVLDSPELGAAQARWAQARVSRDVARRNFDRAERLYRDGIVSERRRLEAEATLREQDASLTAALQTLSALGASPDSGGSGLFVIRAPLDGEVVEKHATEGEVVGPEENLFIVGELNRVWLLLDLYETDLRRLRVGVPARVVADAYPQTPFFARVGLISSVIDTVSRTVKVRVEISNEQHLLKPGMFARAGLALAAPSGALGVPHAAVQSLGGRDVVFVPAGAGRYRATPVELGPPRAGGWLEVRSGLQVGDSVVVSGAFALKTHLLQSANEGSDR